MSSPVGMVSHSIIEKYRNTAFKKGNYVFPILLPGMTATEKNVFLKILRDLQTSISNVRNQMQD